MKDILPAGLAAIDLGTNTFRLVSRGIQLLEYPRIGLGVDKTGRIAAASVRRGLQALAKFARIVRVRRLRVVGVVATSAIREASNGPAFCDTVRRRFGWDVRTITGEEEAELTFLGATATLDLPLHTPVLVSDVGGGSTEIIWGRLCSHPPAADLHPCKSETPPSGTNTSVYSPRRFSILGKVSLQLGSVRMTERYGTAQRASPRQRKALETGVRRILKSSDVPWPSGTDIHVVGVGGTATTLAAILHAVDPYDAARVHGSRVPLASMQKMFDVLSILTPRERSHLPSLPRGRADIIVAGAAIQTEIVRLSGASELIASDTGILTGLILRDGRLRGSTSRRRLATKSPRHKGFL